jgi:uncharacterized membrane protein YraQ (UPF0718 family)
MNLLPSALPWRGLLFFPALLVFIGVLLFSTATLAFFVKQTVSFTRLRKIFAQQTGVKGNIIAAILGAATPFCTCTAIPIFLGMLEADIPPGPATSFLLASPTINLGAIILLLLVFGWYVTLFYTCSCLTAAILVGWIIGRVPRERVLRDYLWFLEDDPAPGTTRLALKKAAVMGRQLTGKFLPWLALATLAGLLIDALVPVSSVAFLDHWSVWIGIPAAALLGSVIYADILLLIPIGFALIQHGASIAIVLTFMIAASGLSLPEMVVLGRILRPQLLALFVVATLTTYVLLGFGFLWV